MLFDRNTIKLLRIPFSFFLMPIYWFALSQVNNINRYDAMLVFIILHGLVYPAVMAITVIWTGTPAASAV